MGEAATATGLVISRDYGFHLTGDGHPERPDRVLAIEDRLRADGLLERAQVIAPRAGFRSIAYMTTVFRRHFGTTPAALRLAARGNP